jgi:acyl-CoA reductase-like NAD-dependent aldehyde dehydrogenase
MSIVQKLFSEPSHLYSGGKFHSGEGALFEVKNKYTGELMGEMAYASSSQIETLVQNAKEAFKSTSQLSWENKWELMQNLIRELKKRKEDFVQLIVEEAGKPVIYAEAEVQRALMNLEFGAAFCLSNHEKTVNLDFGFGKSGLIKRFPVGPVLAFSPFNFPLNLVLHKIIPAIVSGSPVVVKPSPHTPFTAMLLAECLRKSLPDGVSENILQVLSCNNDMAGALVKNPAFPIFTFTGGVETGWSLKALVPQKKVLLELGGNAPIYIDNSVSSELDDIAERCAKGAFGYAGQTCISAQRIYLHEACFKDFLKKITVKTESLKSGNPKNETVTNGPLISAEAMSQIHNAVMEAVHEGAELITGGKALDEEKQIYLPTILTRVNKTLPVCKNEIFGPVVIIEEVKNAEDAFKAMNDSDYGLQASVFTNRLDLSKKAFETLEFGAVLMNEIPGFRLDNMPYGGIKKSGVGREGVQYAWEEFTEPKLLIQ